MAFRIARGLFRLWLVLSVLWIGAVGTVTWWTVPSVLDPDAYLRPADPPFDPDAYLRGLRGDPQPPVTDPDLLRRLESGKDDLWVAKARAAIRFAAVLALAPPAVVLAFGSALIWAFRGFRN
jgi:hypothetical protein